MNLLRERLAGAPKNGVYHTIGIDGRGGAGKSSLARWLVEHELEDFSLSAADDYFEPVDSQLVPGLFNANRFMSDVGQALMKGQRQLKYQPYTWADRPTLAEREIVIDKGLVHEGVKSLSLPIDWDLTIWVDSPRELCLTRYMSRPYAERKSNFDFDQLTVAGQEYARQADEYMAALDPLRSADIIVDGTRSFAEQFGGLTVARTALVEAA